jgi:hypothetical protein
MKEFSCQRDHRIDTWVGKCLGKDSLADEASRAWFDTREIDQKSDAKGVF